MKPNLTPTGMGKEISVSHLLLLQAQACAWVQIRTHTHMQRQGFKIQGACSAISGVHFVAGDDRLQKTMHDKQALNSNPFVSLRKLISAIMLVEV